MKVIYAGFSKTGTKTMADAFRTLGLTCYDSLEYYIFQGDDWMKIYKEGGTIEDFRRMFENVDAVTDVPGCFFWEEILKAFPDAKIVFSMRASEDEWWKSMKKQIVSNDALLVRLITFFSPTSRRMENYFYHTIGVAFHFKFDKPLFRPSACNETMIRKAYRRHNAYVLKHAPKDKLLMIDFKEGWEPLCEFLDLPVPSTPFPHKNKNANLIEDMIETNAFMQRMKIEMMVITGSLFGLFLYGSYKLIRNPRRALDLLKLPVSSLKSLKWT